MSPPVTGMLLGLVGATGLVLVVTYAPPFRSVRLVDRLAPYVHDTPPPSRLLGTATEPGLLTAVRRIFGPAIGDGARLVDRVLGGRAAVRRRLDALGSELSVEDFRIEQVADRTSLDPLARFIDGLLVAIERGTPLAEVLRAQAADVREAGKRRLLEAGGRKEIAMMVPVVFLVLPVTVLFALFPGLISIVSLAQ